MEGLPLPCCLPGSLLHNAATVIGPIKVSNPTSTRHCAGSSFLSLSFLPTRDIWRGSLLQQAATTTTGKLHAIESDARTAMSDAISGNGNQFSPGWLPLSIGGGEAKMQCHSGSFDSSISVHFGGGSERPRVHAASWLSGPNINIYTRRPHLSVHPAQSPKADR